MEFRQARVGSIFALFSAMKSNFLYLCLVVIVVFKASLSYACGGAEEAQEQVKVADRMKAFSTIENLNLTDSEIEEMTSSSPRYQDVKGRHEIPVKCQIKIQNEDLPRLPKGLLEAQRGVAAAIVKFEFGPYRCQGLFGFDGLRIGTESVDIDSFTFPAVTDQPSRQMKLKIKIDDHHSLTDILGTADCEF